MGGKRKGRERKRKGGRKKERKKKGEGRDIGTPRFGTK